MSVRYFSRRIPAFVILLVLYLAPWAVSIPVAGAADEKPDSAAYDVRAGRSSLKKIGGERVLELSDRVHIVHGDIVITSSTGLHYNKRRHTFLLGDVVVKQEGMTMWGDEGEYIKSRESAILRGNVRIENEGWVLTADEVEYSRETRHAWLRGNVVARDSTSTVKADSLFYDRSREIAEAFGHVEVQSNDEGFVATGDHGFYYRRTGEGVLDRNPRLIVDPQADEPVSVVSDTMRVFPSTGRAFAYYTVKIIKGNTITQCDSAVVYDDEQRAELYGTPLAKQNNLSMTGDHMILHYDEDEIRRIDIIGTGEIREAPRDTLVVGRDSWMRGDTLYLHVHDNQVDSIEVVNNATSEYYPTTPGKAEHNTVHGDRMFFQFDNDSLTYVRVTGQAGGVYRYVQIGRLETVDSLRAVADTLLTYIPFDKNAETVKYAAQKIEYYAQTNDLVLNESASLSYRNTEVKGEDIVYYAEYDVLDATGEPELTENAQKYYGERMNYDLEGETGLVVDGSTKFGEGYYTGEHVAKVGDDEMKVWRSVYTTCDLKTPHYHFKAQVMKVYAGDKVVTGPIWLYIGQTPVFYLPFMASNIHHDRHSGFLRPDFEVGITSSEGRFIRNIGYYWATNDYTDFTFVTDFNEGSGLRMFTSNRYRVRYKFNGGVEYNFYRDFSDFTNRWEVRWRHIQHRMPWGITFNTNVHYVSDEDAPKIINRIDDVARVVDRRIDSTANLSKSWGRQVRLNASARRVQNLNITDPLGIRLEMTMPAVTLSIPARNLYFGKASRRQEHRGFWEKVLTNMRYSPTLNGNRRYTEREFRITEVITANQGLGFVSSPKIGPVSFSPGISATNTTIYTDDEILAHVEDVDDTTQVTIPYVRNTFTENDFRWNASVGARTNFYGTFYPRIGKLRGLRHVISPAVTYRYTPARDSRPLDQLVSLSLRNNFDIKVATGDSTTSQAGRKTEGVRKISNLINWTMSGTYDPDASAKEAWSNIRNSFAAQAYGVGLNLSQTIDPYEWSVLSSNFTMRFTVRGNHPFGKSDKLTVRELNIVAEHDTTTGDYVSHSDYRQRVRDVLIQETGGRPEASELELEEGLLPWSFIVDGSYSTTKFGDPRATVRFFSQIDMTTSWKLRYSTLYDIFSQEQTGQSIGVTRDLHCWAMSLERQHFGTEWQFYFRIELKAHPDIFGESGDRGLRGGTLGTGSFF